MTTMMRIYNLLETEEGLTDREISASLGKKHPQSVNGSLRDLAESGVIIRRKGAGRSIRNFRGPQFRAVPKGNTKAGNATNNKKGRTKITERMHRERISPTGCRFRQKVLHLLRQADADVAYSIKKDLSTQIRHPFYKESLRKIPCRNDRDMFIAYANLLAKAQDISFLRKLVGRLSSQQSCLVRRFAKRIGPKAGSNQVMEHTIPVKYVTESILGMIATDTLHELTGLLELYRRGGQRAVDRMDDQTLTRLGLRQKMPEGWCWTDNEADYLARYRQSGILGRVYLQKNES
jgi:hypothetical protein